MRGRHGVTVVEMLVVLSILAILAAILLPAVMHVREAQRRTVCQSRLSDLSLAMAQFEAVHGHFPGALEGQPRGYSGWFCRFSPMARILPHIEQQPLYGQIDFTREDNVPLNPLWDAGIHASVFRTRLPVFICPSDDRGSGQFAGMNYRVSLGVGPSYSEQAGDAAKGAFSVGQFRRTAEFRDGLGATIGLSERRTGSWKVGGYARRDDLWYSGVDQLQVFPPLDAMISLCNSASDAPAMSYVFGGTTWLYGSFENTWYNHAVGPNSTVPSCSAGILAHGFNTIHAIVGATSQHSGGVMVAFMDGAVKFISNSIDLSVWRALATLQGQDPVQLPD